MNWTGGRLQRHSTSNKNNSTQAQRWRFANGLRKKKAVPRTPSHLRLSIIQSRDGQIDQKSSVYHPGSCIDNDSNSDCDGYSKDAIEANSVELKEVLQQDTEQLLTANNNFKDCASTLAAAQPNEHVRSLVHHKTPLNTFKKNLLQRPDWLVTSATKPVDVTFSTAQEMEMFGRHRKRKRQDVGQTTARHQSQLGTYQLNKDDIWYDFASEPSHSARTDDDLAQPHLVSPRYSQDTHPTVHSKSSVEFGVMENLKRLVKPQHITGLASTRTISAANLAQSQSRSQSDRRWSRISLHENALDHTIEAISSPAPSSRDAVTKRYFESTPEHQSKPDVLRTSTLPSGFEPDPPLRTLSTPIHHLEKSTSGHILMTSSASIVSNSTISSQSRGAIQLTEKATGTHRQQYLHRGGTKASSSNSVHTQSVADGSISSPATSNLEWHHPRHKSFLRLGNATDLTSDFFKQGIPAAKESLGLTRGHNIHTSALSNIVDRAPVIDSQERAKRNLKYTPTRTLRSSARVTRQITPIFEEDLALSRSLLATSVRARQCSQLPSVGVGARNYAPISPVEDRNTNRRQINMADRGFTLHEPTLEGGVQADDAESWMRHVFPRDFSQLQSEFKFTTPRTSQTQHTIRTSPTVDLPLHRPIVLREHTALEKRPFGSLQTPDNTVSADLQAIASSHQSPGSQDGKRQQRSRPGVEDSPWYGNVPTRKNTFRTPLGTLRTSIQRPTSQFYGRRASTTGDVSNRLSQILAYNWDVSE